MAFKNPKEEHSATGSHHADTLRKIERITREHIPDLYVTPEIFNLMTDLATRGIKPHTAFHWLRRVSKIEQAEGYLTFHADTLAGRFLFEIMGGPLQAHFGTWRMRTTYRNPKTGAETHTYLLPPSDPRKQRNVEFVTDLMDRNRRGELDTTPPLIETAPWAYCTFAQAQARGALGPLSEALKATPPRRRLDYIDYLSRFLAWPASVLATVREKTRAELST